TPDAIGSFESAYQQSLAWLPPMDNWSLGEYEDILTREEVSKLLEIDTSNPTHLPFALLAQAKVLHHSSTNFRMRAEAAEAQLELQRRETALLSQSNRELVQRNHLSQEKVWNVELQVQEVHELNEKLKEANLALQKEANDAKTQLVQARESIQTLKARETMLSSQLDQALSAYTRDTHQLRRTILNLREELCSLSQGRTPELERHLNPPSPTDTIGISNNVIEEARRGTSSNHKPHPSWLALTLNNFNLNLPEPKLRNFAPPKSSHVTEDYSAHFITKHCHQRSLSLNILVNQPSPDTPLKQVDQRTKGIQNASNPPNVPTKECPLTPPSRVSCEGFFKDVVILDFNQTDPIHWLAHRLLTISDRMLQEKMDQALPKLSSNSPSSLSSFEPDSDDSASNLKPFVLEPTRLTKPTSHRSLSHLRFEENPSEPSAKAIPKHRRSESSLTTPACEVEVALQRVMKGEFVYKSSRTLLGQEKRHLRYMWINPQSHTVYWCAVDPGTRRSLYIDCAYRTGARSATVQGVRLVADPWSPSDPTTACLTQGISPLNVKASLSPMGEGGHRARWTAHHNQLPVLSILIQTGSREIKFKARNIASHKAWETAFAYLQTHTLANGSRILPSSVGEGLTSTKPFPTVNTFPNLTSPRARPTKIKPNHPIVTPTLTATYAES
ncbi:hypothetical protein L0F63_002682, partial [Massospora cicadina]